MSVLLFLALFAQTADDRALAYMQQVQASTKTPAVAVAVARGGKIVFSRAIGTADLENMVPATPASVINIGSVSKVITAVAVMQLVEQGKVALDDPIQKFVPSFPDKGHPITIRHLLTQTSGIRHYRASDFPESVDNENTRPYHSFEEAIGIFKNDPLLFEPGKFYFYSSYAVNLLQGVVEKASGLPFEEYLRRFVWTPAAMSSTSFDVPERVVRHRERSYWIVKGEVKNYPYGDLTYKFASGGMLSTAEDLARFGIAFNHGALLKPATVALMTKPVEGLMQFREKGEPQKPDFEQALIWRIRRDRDGRAYLNHCGTVKGFNACLIDYIGEDFVVVITGNSYPEVPALREAVAVADFFRNP